MRPRAVFAFLAVAVALFPAFPGEFPGEFFSYLEARRGGASWELGTPKELGGVEVQPITLRSQVWRDIPWEHRLFLYLPSEPETRDTVVLFITGSYKPGLEFYGVQMAESLAMPLGVLFDVPVQPLFGLREDALIAYTFRRYLEEGDPEWPLLFPMTRAAVAAMEAIQALAPELIGTEGVDFILAGGSKRGWTTYLAAAAEPDLVRGIVPMVFDILNIPAQIAHQRFFWGKLSHKLSPYVAQGLFDVMGDPHMARLLWMVDPYTYRFRLTMPKLIMLGTNDAYWPITALHLYLEGLPDPKWVLYIPNAGHSLLESHWTVEGLVSFARAVALGTGIPTLSAGLELGSDAVALSVAVSAPPAEAELWVAESEDRDFRDDTWAGEPLPRVEPGLFRAEISRPQRGWTAFMAAFRFRTEAGDLRFTTPVWVYP